MTIAMKINYHVVNVFVILTTLVANMAQPNFPPYCIMEIYSYKI